jgi:hypothetical protein
MRVDLSELMTILEEEIVVGEALQHNLEEQKKAVLTWDAVTLWQQIDAREPWLRQLAALEERRQGILKEMTSHLNPMTLGELIAGFPAGVPERDRLRQLQDGARRIFSRLRREEHYLHGLMENLQAHIQEAMGATPPTAVPLYSETGATLPSCSSLGMIRGKA